MFRPFLWLVSCFKMSGLVYFQGMITLSSIVGLWALARPVDLPRRARLAVNSTLAMAGVQVRVSMTMSQPI